MRKPSRLQHTETCNIKYKFTLIFSWLRNCMPYNSKCTPQNANFVAYSTICDTFEDNKNKWYTIQFSILWRTFSGVCFYWLLAIQILFCIRIFVKLHRPLFQLLRQNCTDVRVKQTGRVIRFSDHIILVAKFRFDFPDD